MQHILSFPLFTHGATPSIRTICEFHVLLKEEDWKLACEGCL